MFAPEERAALAHKASGYCSKLLKRTDQCQAVLACSHLYWQPEAEVGGRVGRQGGLMGADGGGRGRMSPPSILPWAV